MIFIYDKAKQIISYINDYKHLKKNISKTSHTYISNKNTIIIIRYNNQRLVIGFSVLTGFVSGVW